MKLNELFCNESNPRTITEVAFKRLIRSILTQPDMMAVRPMVFDTKRGILGGNMRDRALNWIADVQAGEFEELIEKIRKDHTRDKKKHPLTVTPEQYVFWQNLRTTKEIPDAWVKDVSGWPVAEQDAFVVKDNAGFGEWDFDMLALEFEAETLADYGVNIPADWGEATELEPEAAPAPKSDTVIKLEYDAETYEKVKARLATIAATPEDAVCQILGL